MKLDAEDTRTELLGIIRDERDQWERIAKQAPVYRPSSYAETATDVLTDLLAKLEES